MKPRLVADQLLTLHSNWLVDLVGEYFELVTYDPTFSYDKHDCFYTNHHVLSSRARAWRDNGGKVVIDNLWERPQPQTGCYTLWHPAWFWYQESLWYRYLGYDQYQPEFSGKYLALMPMRLRKPHRDYMLKLLGNTVDQFVWSYQAQGRNLPRDRDPEDWDSQRYFDPDWYNSTQFSLVLETTVLVLETTVHAPYPFITEKTFKPIAFQHPFIIVGCSGTLTYLQKLGFETWDNLWDESYDNLDNWQDRCYNITQQVRNYTSGRDSVTQQKLQHNRDHFFDQVRVENCIRKQILEPLLNYAETR